MRVGASPSHPLDATRVVVDSLRMLRRSGWLEARASPSDRQFQVARGNQRDPQAHRSRAVAGGRRRLDGKAWTGAFSRSPGDEFACDDLHVAACTRK